MGRWRHDAYNMASTPLFWVCLKVFYQVHAPMDHLQSFMQALPPDGCGHVAQLVCGKAKAIASEFETLLVRTDWNAIADVLPIRQHREVNILAVGLTLNLAAGYHRRAVRQLERPGF